MVEHAPELVIKEGTDLTAVPGAKLELHADASGKDSTNIKISYRIYEEASSECARNVVLQVHSETAVITIPETARKGDHIHIIVKAQAGGHHRLVHYQQVIITVVR